MVNLAGSKLLVTSRQRNGVDARAPRFTFCRLSNVIAVHLLCKSLTPHLGSRARNAIQCKANERKKLWNTREY